MHKTGGQTLSQVINSCFPGNEFVGYHFPFSQLPAHATNKPIVGMVRNPWDWYLSWYAFNTNPQMYNPLYVVLSDGGNGDFESTVTNLVNLGSDNPESVHYRKALKELLPETLEGNRGVGLTRSSIDELAQSGQGYYSWLFERMHGNLDSELLHIGYFENLGEDFIKIMVELNVEQFEEMKSQFNSIGRTNTSKHSHYSHYYSEELKQLVGTKDASLVERFGYQFQSSSDAAKYVVPLSANVHFAFKKLLGKKINFLTLASGIDVSPIRQKLAQQTARQWAESGREKLYEPHRNTQALLLIHDEDFRHSRPTNRPLFDTFRAELEPLFQRISEFYGGEGYFVRALFAKLHAGGKISSHIDRVYTLLNCNRVHLPIITNRDVWFSVGGETINMPAGKLVEINNATVHSVENKSNEDRIHLIIDWVPHHTARGEMSDSTSRRKMRPPVRQVFAENKHGRNAPCHCGSGKKFKRCHGQLS